MRDVWRAFWRGWAETRGWWLLLSILVGIAYLVLYALRLL